MLNSSEVTQDKLSLRLLEEIAIIKQEAQSRENYSIKRETFDYLQELIDFGADPNFRYKLRKIHENSLPAWYDHSIVLIYPLFDAIQSNKLDLVRFLLENGADPNFSATLTISPVWLALDQPVILQALLDAGANPNQPNSRSDYPLHAAIAANQIQIVSQLLRAGADYDQPNDVGERPIFLTILHQNIDILFDLLSNGVNVNIYDRMRGLYPLDLALDLLRYSSQQIGVEYNPVIVDLLLVAGAKSKNLIRQWQNLSRMLEEKLTYLGFHNEQIDQFELSDLADIPPNVEDYDEVLTEIKNLLHVTSAIKEFLEL